MPTKKKIFLYGACFSLLLAFSGYYYVFIFSRNNQRNVKQEKAVSIEAATLVKEYTSNESVANNRYLDRAIQVSGTVISTGKNAAGFPTLLLEGDTSAMMHVFCTFTQPLTGIQSGNKAVVKGICTGFMNDVILIDAILIKP